VVVDERTGRAFVLDGDDTVGVLDTRTGALLQRVAVGRAAIALAVDERTGRVFVVNSYMRAGATGTVSVLDALDGHLLRTVPVGYVPYAVAVDERAGRVFILNTGTATDLRGAVSVLDATNGRFLRTIYAGPNGGPCVTYFALTVDARHSRLLAITGGLINNQPGMTLSVLDTRTGRLVHTRVQPTFGRFSVDEGTNRTFVVSNGVLSVLQTTSGQLLRRVPEGQSFGALVDGRRGHVYLGGPTGMSILDAATETLRRTVALGRYPAEPMAVETRTGHVLVTISGPFDANYMPIEEGRVSVLDGRTGAVLRTVTVGPGPAAVAIDERTGHAFVVSSGGILSSADSWGWVPSPLRRWLPFLPPPGVRRRIIPGSVSTVDVVQ
jgi:DNA-binding beta-propeller fold protein YncE